MSNLRGHVLCPQCEKGSFYLEHWLTYISVTCRSCGHKMTEIPLEHLLGYPLWEAGNPVE